MTLETLRQLGYEVDADDLGNVAVRGFGVAIMVRADDAVALASLTNPKAHAQRKAQHERHEDLRLRALNG